MNIRKTIFSILLAVIILILFYNIVAPFIFVQNPWMGMMHRGMGMYKNNYNTNFTYFILIVLALAAIALLGIFASYRPDMNRCKQCGTEIENEQWRVCPNCGTRIYSRRDYE